MAINGKVGSYKILKHVVGTKSKKIDSDLMYNPMVRHQFHKFLHLFPNFINHLVFQIPNLCI